MKILQILVLMFGLFIVVTNAQQVSEYAEKSTVSGTVFDDKGAVIPQTKVTFTNKAGAVLSTMTDRNGVYQIEINEGKYTISFFKEGFEISKIENYKLAFRTEMRLDISLDVLTYINTIEIVTPTKKKTKN